MPLVPAVKNPRGMWVNFSVLETDLVYIASIRPTKATSESLSLKKKTFLKETVVCLLSPFLEL